MDMFWVLVYCTKCRPLGSLQGLLWVLLVESWHVVNTAFCLQVVSVPDLNVAAFGLWVSSLSVCGFFHERAGVEDSNVMLIRFGCNSQCAPHSVCGLMPAGASPTTRLNIVLLVVSKTYKSKKGHVGPT